MKLYLSSYRLGRQPEAMLTASASNTRVAVIQNAGDCWTDAAKRQSVLERECADLRALGLEPVELDLRQFFGQRAELDRELQGFGYCWVCGGNSFVLRRAFRLSGFDDILQDQASYAEARLTYGGYSAGICVLTPTLEGIHLADDPTSNPEGYSGPVLWDGLALYPYCLAPHFRSDHPETRLIDQSVEYFIEKKLPFVALHDGEAIVFDTVDKQSRVVGSSS
jgi:dipeptidase E